MAKLANVYKIPIEQIGKLGDAINHLSNNSPAKASDIVNALGRVGGVAKQFGLTELQTASLANTFISLGKSPEVAGTAINGMLTKLMTADKQGKKFQATLQMMGLESKDLKKAISENGEQALQDFLKTLNKLPKEQQMGALVDLFGLEYADDIAVLAGNVDLYEKSIRALKDTGKDGKLSFEGSMSKEFAARSETTAANWEIFKNSLKELGIVIGSTLLPAINSLMSSIAPIIHSISDWAAANPTLTRTLIGFIGGLALFKTTLLGGMFIVNIFRTGILQITGLFMRLGMLLMANPIGIAIGLLAVAAYLLYDNWSAVVGGAKALWQSLVTFFSGLWAKLQEIFEPIGQWFGEKFQQAWDAIVAIFSGVGSWFGEKFQGAWDAIVNIFSNLGSWFGERWADVTNALAEIGSWLGEKFQEGWDAIGNIFGNLGSWFGEKWTDVTNALSDANTWLGDKFQSGRDKVNSAFEKVGSWFGDRWNDIKNGVQEADSWFGEKFESAKENTQNPFQSIGSWFSERWNDIQSALKEIPEWFRNLFNDAMENAKSIVKSGIDALKGFFNFDWSLPEIKLPHFNISGSFSLMPPSIPSFSVDWYARGGVFNSPSIIGVGEAGQEAVMPLERNTGWISILAQKLAERMPTDNAPTGYSLPAGDIVIQIAGHEFGRVAIQEINKEQERAGQTLLKI